MTATPSCPQMGNETTEPSGADGPPQIWLEPSCCASGVEGRCWSATNDFPECDGDPPQEPTRYVRADLSGGAGHGTASALESTAGTTPYPSPDPIDVGELERSIATLWQDLQIGEDAAERYGGAGSTVVRTADLRRLLSRSRQVDGLVSDRDEARAERDAKNDRIQRLRQHLNECGQVARFEFAELKRKPEPVADPLKHIERISRQGLEEDISACVTPATLRPPVAADDNSTGEEQ